MSKLDKARRAYLSHYTGGTLGNYTLDLRIFFEWCERREIKPLKAKRHDLEDFSRYLITERGNSPRSARRRLQTVRGFYKLTASDGVIKRDPSASMRMPKYNVDRSTIAVMTPRETARIVEAAQKTSPAHHALTVLMYTLGMRVTEACSVYIEDIVCDTSGYTTVTFKRKGGKIATRPVPVPLIAVVEAAKAGRTSGPLIQKRNGEAQDRAGAYRWVKALAQKAGLPKNIHPHTFRHSAITDYVNSGATAMEAQLFSGHADLRSLGHYYHPKVTHDLDGGHVVARILSREL